MIFNVYRVAQDGAKDLFLKEQYSSDVVEYVTGEILGDTLPAILSPKAAELYNGMRLMKKGDTFTYGDYFVECMK